MNGGIVDECGVERKGRWEMRRCEGVDLYCRIYGRLLLGCLAGYVVEMVACDEGIRSCRNCESGWAA